MDKYSFEVRPVASYRTGYPGSGDGGAAAEPPGGGTLVVLALLVLGLSLGLIGCYLKVDVTPEPPEPVPVCGGGDDGPWPNQPVCRDGDLEYCEGSNVVTRNCDEHCESGMGYSNGCDAQAADPCLCQYDIVAGSPPPVMPDELRCVDDWTLEQCEGYECQQRSCDEVCQETHGYDWYSLGCDLSVEDPCQCEYGLIGGEPVYCEPGELLWCIDENTVERCDDEGVPTTQNCADLCREDFGDFYESDGCDAAQPDNICGCYPIVDGGMPAM
jgi:hypothetical protein